MNEMALAIEARRYYRFFPALIEIEARCLRTGYQVGENLKAFCDMISPTVSKRIGSFYDDIKRFDYRLRDWNYNMLADMDIPVFDNSESDGWNSNPRPKREWDGEPWEADVVSILKNSDPSVREERYLQYERRQQAIWLLKAREFRLV